MTPKEFRIALTTEDFELQSHFIGMDWASTRPSYEMMNMNPNAGAKDKQ